MQSTGVGISMPDQDEFDVTIIASDIMVVDVRNAQGVAAEANPQNEANSGLIGSTQNEQVQILTLAGRTANRGCHSAGRRRQQKTRRLVMDNPGTALMQSPTPPKIQPLTTADLALIETVREELVLRGD